VKRLYVLYNYLIYRKKRVDEHGVHSPFVYDLLVHTIYNHSHFYAYEKMEALRAKLLKSTKSVHCIDLGAGSLNQNKTSKSVKELVSTAAKPPKFSQLLFRLVNHFQPQNVLELGTSVGISTASMALANSKTQVISIEGCPEIAAVAKENFQKLGLRNIQQLTGNFDDLLPQVLSKMDKLDFVFFDGNHRKAPTMNYFKQCLEKAHADSVFVFDDIYWSAEMKQAWHDIKNHERVTVTIDLFFMGIVFFRKEQAKQHFIISY
jgi:predicted O-methyltransferase YrrM